MTLTTGRLVLQTAPRTGFLWIYGDSFFTLRFAIFENRARPPQAGTKPGKPVRFNFLNDGTDSMKKSLGIAAILVFLLSGWAAALDKSAVVILAEPGFPAADSAVASPQQLAGWVPGAQLASVEQLRQLLNSPATALLILPYGSAFPEEAWPDIHQFLQRGGNLVVLGGQPFTRAAYRDHGSWKLREYSVRYIRPLMIDQYQTTPGSDGLEFQANPEIPLQLPAFPWKRAFSPVIRLSAVDLYKRGGAAGAIDARLDTLAWGVKQGRKLSAPAMLVDHLRNGFNGGRWVFLNADLPAEFYGSAAGSRVVADLAELAVQGSQEFIVRPVLPLYLPGEPVQLDVQWTSARASSAALTVKIATYPEGEPTKRSETTATLPSAQSTVLPAPSGKGLHVVEATLMEGDKVRAIYHSGFWIRDEEYLRAGPRLTVNQDYFELDGHPLAVVGTTYMSSEVQRLYFEYPNVYVWNRDLAQISGGDLNMIRTGWWTGWDKFCNENGQPYERTLRTLEAFLMTARKNGLPLQFNFFAFLPDVLAGVNPYLDPESVRKQRTLISSVVARFHDVPWLAWDFINEPSISQHLWTMRPNGDPIEVAKWNEWLSQRYPDRAALAAMWNVPIDSVQGTIPLPDDSEFTLRGEYIGHNSLKVYDYFLFSQEVFAHWVKTMASAVRETGSQQLVTVGQDEGGIQDRLSPAFWGEFVDFTTNHSWWQNDYVCVGLAAGQAAGQDHADPGDRTAARTQLRRNRAPHSRERSGSARTQNCVVIHSRVRRHRMALEHEFLHDGEQRNADRGGADRRHREAGSDGHGSLRSFRQILSGTSAQSAAACDRHRYVPGVPIFGDRRLAAGSATQSRARSGLLRSVDALRDR